LLAYENFESCNPSTWYFVTRVLNNIYSMKEVLIELNEEHNSNITFGGL
jgi:hypothetical protein